MTTGNICPVCGYDDLIEPAYKDGYYPSYEICYSCGYEYGYDDESEGITHEQWRDCWIAEGMKWWSLRVNKPAPDGWNPKKQLENINVFL